LAPRAGGSPDSPIKDQTATAPLTFTKPGFYPFECVEHVDQGMLGVIWVTAQ
jgi:plastocyanin